MKSKATRLLNKVLCTTNFQRGLSCSASTSSEAAHIVKSKVEAINIPRLPLTNFIWDQSVKIHGDKIALV